MDANHATEKFTVLTPAEAETLAAIAERIFPATDTPGAVQIGAVHYIEIALAGDYAALAPLYRQGLRSINRCARSRCGARFADLVDDEKDAMLIDFEAGRVAGFKKAAEFFETVRYHVLEGVFCEPQYGGNKTWPVGAWWIFPASNSAMPMLISIKPRRPGARGGGLPKSRRKSSGGGRESADVCIVGVGGMGGIMAKELASAGLKVVGFERGPAPKQEDYAPRDSIRFLIRPEQLEWVRHEPTTTRNKTGEKTRRAISHQPAQCFGRRAASLDRPIVALHAGRFQTVHQRDRKRQRRARPGRFDGYDIIDWPLGYDDLEPYYERFEWEFGVSGQAGAESFRRDRAKRGFPLPPLRHSARMKLFAEACKKLGYHPYDTAAGILSEPYRPPEPFDTRIAERPACVYCAHCNFYGCHVHAKSATLYTTIPVALETGNFDLKTRSKVFRINSEASGRSPE